MRNKPANLLKIKKFLEGKVQSSLSHLEEFTREMAGNIDFDSFDVLSVTRTDHAYTYTHRLRVINCASEPTLQTTVKRKLFPSESQN